MITFNNIVSKFEEFCTDHFFIKTFSYGSPADVDLDKFEQYPLLHLVYTGGDYNSPKAKTYNLEVYILTLPPSEADKNAQQKEAISDAEQVAEDILADIQNGGNIFQFGFMYDLVNASVTPLEEEKSNALAGCLLDMAIQVPYTYDSCNAPLTGVEPEGSTTPSFKARGLLRVREEDGSPDVLSVATINVPNGSLTDDGDGKVSLSFDSLPTGAEGQTLVYQSGAWVAGYPISTGQQSIFKRITPSGFDNSFGGALLPEQLSFIPFSSGNITYDNALRAGAVFGMDPLGTVLSANPVTIGSTIQVELKFEVTVDTAGPCVFSIQARSGMFDQVVMALPTITTAGTTSHTVTSNLATVATFQISNNIAFQVQSLPTGTYSIDYLKVTINHA